MKRKWRWAWLLILLPCVVFSIFLSKAKSNPLGVLNKYQVKSGPTYDDPKVDHRQTYYIQAPFSVVSGIVEGWQYGSGSSTAGGTSSAPQVYGWWNEDTDETWMVYKGMVVLPRYPYMGDEVVTAGTSSSWTTIIYRAPRTSIPMTELMRRQY